MTDKTKKTAPVKSAPKKKDMKILYEAVQENPTRNYIIMGALTRAGLYNQYCKEKRLYGSNFNCIFLKQTYFIFIFFFILFKHMLILF